MWGNTQTPQVAAERSPQIVKRPRLGSCPDLGFPWFFGSKMAALFAERRESEARLARSNMLLERERENKLMNVQAALAAIAHEMRQPLAAITTNAGAAGRWLQRTPPDKDEAWAALDRIKDEGLRASEVFDNIRALFGKVNQERHLVDVNNIILSVIRSLDRHRRYTRTLRSHRAGNPCCHQHARRSLVR
jgi:signal transduction histidine kinase